MPDPIHTYTALAFVVGVVVGIGLSGVLLRRAERTLIQARQLLHQAMDKNNRATAFYRNAVLESEQGIERMKQIAQGMRDDA